MDAALIPREVLFGNPERTNPQLSPDGRYLAYLAPDRNDVLQVWLRTLGQQDERILTADKKRGIRAYFWSYMPEHLIYMQDSDGDENWHLYLVNVKTLSVRDLTPFQGVLAYEVALDPAFPEQALAAMNLNDRSKHDVYRINLQNGAVEFDTENPGNVTSWTADAKLQVRAAIATTPDGGSELRLRDSPAQPWRIVRQWGPDDEGWTYLFSADGRTLYFGGSHDANAMRLIALDLNTGQEQVLAEDPQYDTGGLLTHPLKRTVEAVAFYRDKLEWQVLDASVADDFAALAKVRRGEYAVCSRDLADKTWLVYYRADDGPVYHYVYERQTKASTFLFSHQPKLEGLPLARTQSVAFPSRDGLTLHGYLTTPVAAPARNLPAVLLVHGGPWGRDTWGFNATVQWLANRGYAVLQVNFRGSAGYGKAFLNAGNREWGAKMHDDVVDGAKWLMSQGIADPQRTAIMGGSYGGYAALAGLAFTPEVFAAGVDLVGPSSLVTLLRSIPPYWKPMMALFVHRVGDPDTEEEFLKSRSPLHSAARITKPLLIGQGANDPRVKQAESEQIVAAMRKAGKPVEYVVYADEGHGMARPENRLHFHAVAEEFLARHIGGRAEVSGEIKGHSGASK